MKKMLALLLVVCIAVGTVGCSTAQPTDTTAPTESTTGPTKEPLHRTYILYKNGREEILERFGTPEESNTPLDIPVYYEHDLLFHEANRFYLSYDSSLFRNQSNFYESYGTNSTDVLSALPTVLRVRSDNSFYAVYDTDTGYRIYLFVDAPENTLNIRGNPTYFDLAGCPIAIKKGKMLAFSDFKDIQIGDPIEKVEAIDDVATLHKRSMANHGYSGLAYGASEEKRALASVHYLKDGILKIKYSIKFSEGTKEPDITVLSINFSKDFSLPNALDEMRNYKIKDIDLPTA